MQIEAKLGDLGFILPEPVQLPPGIVLPFAWTRVHGNRIYISGHGPLDRDGTYSGSLGKVPSEVSLEKAQQAAQKAALSVLSSLKRELGDLDRVTAWLMVTGFVNADPGYGQTTLVMNSFSDVVLRLYGSEVGRHARTAIGVAALPFNVPVVVAAEVEFV